MNRSFYIGLLLSVLLHLIFISAPGWNIGSLLAKDDASVDTRIEARLIASVKKPKLVTGRTASKAMNKQARPTHAAAPVPQQIPVQTTSSPDVIAIAEPSVEPEKMAEPIVKEPISTKPAVTEPERVSGVGANVVPDPTTALPRSGHIRYSITRGDGGFVVGQSVHEWTHDGKRYSISSVSETTGIAAIFKPAKVTQTSEGGFLNGELKPDDFRFDKGENDIVSASFDWNANQVTLDNGQVIPVTDGAEDFLSMFYQLSQVPQKTGSFVMAVATGRKVERYVFEWLGEEELTLSMGRFRAWHVRVRAESGGKDTIEIWLGRDVAGLPIKVRNIDRKGEMFDQVAEEIDYEGK
jgi:Protein of unknown function (DUF3108)